MTIVMGYLNNGSIPFPGVIADMFLAVVVAYLAGIIVPVKKAADGFAGLFQVKEGSVIFILLSTVIYAFYYAVVFAVLFTAKAIGFPPYFLNAVVSGIPSSFVAGYIVSLAVTPIALKLTHKMCR